MSYAQPEVSFTAKANAKKVFLSSYFSVTYTLENADAQSFVRPPFRGFKVFGTPTKSSSVTNFNGKVSRSESYTYRLQPKETGTFTINPAKATANKNEILSNPITIEVLEDTEAAFSQENEDIYVRVEITDSVACIGQQVLVDYVLYTKVGVEQYSILKEPDYEGAFAKGVRYYDNNIITTVINGQTYATKKLSRIAVFPQQKGKIDIGPLVLQVFVLADNSTISPLLQPTRALTIQSYPTGIKVLAQPPKADSLFSGAIGQYEVSYYKNRNSLSTDDGLAIQCKVVGTGDPKSVRAPLVEFSMPFEQYPAKVISENTFEKQGKFFHEKVYEILAVPEEAGSGMINLSFQYYDPDSSQLFTKFDSFPIAVSPGTGKKNALPTVSENAADSTFVKPMDRLVKGMPEPFSHKPIYWVLYFLPLVLFSGFSFYNRWNQKRKAQLSPEEIQSIFLKRVDDLQAQASHSKETYQGLSNLVLDYLEQQKGVPKLQAVEQKDLAALLQQFPIEKAWIDQLLAFLRQCDAAAYGGMLNTTLFEEAKEQIKALEI